MGTSARLLGLRWQRLVVATVLVAVVWPAVGGRDSFPLSTYPVYANAGPRVVLFHTAVGIRPDGSWARLSPPIIADTDDPFIAEDQVADAVTSGRADILCSAIVGRLPEAGPGGDPTDAEADADGNRIVAVEVVGERVDVVAVATGQAPPLERTVHARCQATR